MAVRSEFELKIPEEEAEKLTTVGAAVDYLYPRLLASRLAGLSPCAVIPSMHSGQALNELAIRVTAPQAISEGSLCHNGCFTGGAPSCELAARPVQHDMTLPARRGPAGRRKTGLGLGGVEVVWHGAASQDNEKGEQGCGPRTRRFGVLRLRSGPKNSRTSAPPPGCPRMPPLSFSFGIPDPQASLFFKTILFRRKSIGTAAPVCATLNSVVSLDTTHPRCMYNS